MNIVTEKLGELSALQEMAVETLEKGEPAFAEAYTEIDIQEMIDENQNLVDNISNYATDNEIDEEVMTKAESVFEKLTKMRSNYLQGDWDDVDDLVEWLGFLEGALVIHWAVVSGSAKELDNDDLTYLVKTGYSYHHETFHRLIETAKQVGIQEL